jgi:hypothetical protein
MIYPIPNNYIQEEHLFAMSYLQGYDHWLYFNLDDPIEDSDFANWEIRVYDLDGNLRQTIGALTKDIISGSAYRFYCTFTPDGTYTGLHYLAIYNTSTGEVKYSFQDSPFSVIALSEVEQYVWLKFRNSSDLDNFNYEDFPSNYQEVFLPMNAVSYDYEYEIKSYTSVSSKKRRDQKTGRHKIVTINTELFNEQANDMMSSVTIHDEIYINGERVKISQGFKPNVNRDMNVSQGEIKFYIEKYSTINYKK